MKPTYKPLKLSTYLGFAVTLASFVYLAISLGQRLFTANTAAGSPLMACLVLLNGVTLIILGIVGEYIGRIYDETKNRPLYILRGRTGEEQARSKGVIWSVR
ncbi:hypothetical protein [Pelotomaculum propionicicum]|uniref:Prophage bactoprenol glucosyl transferase n=1 Tax=Pelotomaculum propionicicum TaxID=258475 RepID=A0A4Y7RZP3_9FIRM|nr:hypothetical protein [Pelotomaculum propionicicum]TEB13747.1 Prophage bactoprenol glucosyl transferase [Pelotomaculum propionicicum]